MVGGTCNYRATMQCGARVGQNQQPTIWPLCECVDRPLRLSSVLNRSIGRLYRERGSSGLYGSHQRACERCGLRVVKHCDSGNLRRNLVQKFYPLASHSELEICDSGNVAARPCEACDETCSDRVDDLQK